MSQFTNRISRLAVAHVDGPLLGVVLLLMATGMVVLYSASNAGIGRVSGQAANMAVALGVMWLLANIPPHVLRRLAVPAYVAGLAMLVLVAIPQIGVEAKAQEALDVWRQADEVDEALLKRVRRLFAPAA